MDNMEHKQANDNNLFVQTQGNSSLGQYKVAGYLRLSKEDGDKEESDSIVSQKNIIKSKIKELGKDFELVDFYIDDGYTGLNTNRPAFQKMLRDIESQKIDTVMTKDLSRLSRNSFEANYYIELYFLERNIRYISILDNVDTFLKSSNNDMIQFKTLINDWYSKDISRKVKSGVWARKEKGLYLGSRAPFGYEKSRNNKNQLIINQEQAKIVKMIFEKFDNGEKQVDIARYLEKNKFLAPSSYNDRGILRKKVYNWTSSVRKILQNKVYLGHTEYGKRINLSYKSKKVKYMPRDEWKIVENTHESIIDKELFERVQRKLNIEAKTKSQKHEWILNGLVYCKECNSKMILKVEHTTSKTIKSKKLHCMEGTKKNAKVSCNRKSKGIREEVITKIVLKNIANKIEKIVNANKIENLILKQYHENNSKMYDDAIKNLKNQLTKIEHNISSLYEDYKSKLLEEEDYKRFYKSELERKNSIRLNMAKLVEEKNNRPTVSHEKLKNLTNQLSNIDTWIKDILDDIIYSIEVDIENNVFINYRYNIFEEV